MGTYLLVRLSEEDKADLFIFAKEHRTTASEIVRQLIRGTVRPEIPHLVSSGLVDRENVAASPGGEP
jgi:predicted transcriptional regulator